jgi:hypothetical protein
MYTPSIFFNDCRFVLKVITMSTYNTTTYRIKNDISVFGRSVPTFPQGIKEAFTALFEMLPDGMNRSYYGISYMDETGRIIYKVETEEKSEGEAEKYNCKRYVIEKGDYLAVTLNNWRSNTDCIKDIFYQMMTDDRADKMTPVVEWYKSDNEMLCLVKIKN